MDQRAANTINLLLLKQLRTDLSDAEQAELNAWIGEDAERREMVAQLNDPAQLQQLMQDYVRRHQQMDMKLSQALPQLPVSTLVETFNAPNPSGTDTTPTVPLHRIHLLRRTFFRYAAAIILIAGAATAYLWNTQKEKPDETAKTTEPVPAKNDVPAPMQTKAILTLADGKQIAIEMATSGALAREGQTEIRKSDNGSITYHGDAQPKISPSSPLTPITYNTLTVPRGSRIAQLTLSDGTQVWLNTESSITYPVAFTAATRTVTITGEAYFEVAKDASHPFVVQTVTDRVTVLGTHFNVNAYADESAGVTTTLLEGKVKVEGAARSGQYTRVLAPGQQSVSGAVTPASVSRAMAWKNGEFQFDQADLQQVMRQLARWYDIEVEYRGSVRPRKFGGAIKRNLSLGDLLEGLKSTGLTFTIEGKKLIVE